VALGVAGSYCEKSRGRKDEPERGRERSVGEAVDRCDQRSAGYCWELWWRGEGQPNERQRWSGLEWRDEREKAVDYDLHPNDSRATSLATPFDHLPPVPTSLITSCPDRLSFHLNLLFISRLLELLWIPSEHPHRYESNLSSHRILLDPQLAALFLFDHHRRKHRLFRSSASTLSSPAAGGGPPSSRLALPSVNRDDDGQSLPTTALPPSPSYPSADKHLCQQRSSVQHDVLSDIVVT
jgi:hypothetical protein